MDELSVEALIIAIAGRIDRSEMGCTYIYIQMQLPIVNVIHPPPQLLCLIFFALACRRTEMCSVVINPDQRPSLFVGLNDEYDHVVCGERATDTDISICRN